MHNKQADVDITSLEDYYGFAGLTDDTDAIATDARDDDAAAPVKQETNTPEETEHEAMVRFFFGKKK